MARIESNKLITSGRNVSGTRKTRFQKLKEVIRNNKEVLLVIGLFVTSIVVTWAITASAHQRPVMVQKTSKIYIVENYDTLWGICDDYVPEGMEIRTYIDIVKRFNDIENDQYIYPGQRIEIPIFVDVYRK